MTSKSLFFKGMKQDFEQRIWLPVIFFITGFLCLEIVLISRLEAWSENVNFAERIHSYLLNEFFAPHAEIMLLTIIVAALSALSGFAFMHSAKRLDVYHSLPIKREVLFWQRFCYGILYYVVPLVLHVLICVLICVANGIAGKAVLLQAVWFTLGQIIFYITFYAVVITAVCLTGNIVISVLGAGLLSIYSLGLYALQMALMEKFFTTYHYMGAKGMIPAISPGHIFFQLVVSIENSSDPFVKYTDYVGDYVKLVCMAVIYTGIALFLYKKRPTEAAGRTIAFSVTEPVIKAVIVIPASFVSGYIFDGIFYNSRGYGWFLFGVIFGFLLACPIMEIIFRKDVKALGKHPMQLLFNGVCVMAIFGLFRFDLFGYDSYLPKETEVESYAVSFGSAPYIYIYNQNMTNYRMEHMVITDNADTRRLIESGVAATRKTRLSEMGLEQESSDYYDSMLVKYQLKNGKAVYRNYLVNLADEQVLQDMAATCDTMEYKLGVYPVLQEGRSDNYVGLLLNYAYGIDSVSLSKEQMETFVETYKRELTNFKFEEFLTEYPVANLAFAVKLAETEDGYVMRQLATKDFGIDDYDEEESGYTIYPSFTQTIALLKEYGVDVYKGVAAEDVISIIVEDNTLEADDHDGLLTKMAVVEYTAEAGQQEEIAQILPGLVQEQLLNGFMEKGRVEEYINVCVRYDMNGREEYEYAVIQKGMMPAFLSEELEAKKKEIQK